jgi:hypothetical protein
MLFLLSFFISDICHFTLLWFLTKISCLSICTSCSSDLKIVAPLTHVSLSQMWALSKIGNIVFLYFILIILCVLLTESFCSSLIPCQNQLSHHVKILYMCILSSHRNWNYHFVSFETLNCWF